MRRFFRVAAQVLMLAVALGIGSGAMASAAPAPDCSAATNPLSCACSTQTGTDSSQSPACSADGSDKLTGSDGVIKKVSLLLAFISGIVAVIIIIISGFRYVISDGDAQKAASARSGIIGAAVGLGIIALSTTIVVFIVSKL